MLPQLYQAHHSRHLEDLPFWLELAGQRGDPILEMGCGTGRVLIPLAQAGYRTIGLDRDLSMLRFLQANIDSKLQPIPRLIAADITEFNLAAQFPLIILPCNTLSTLSDNQRLACLTCVSRHLQKGGIFAVCLPNPEWLMHLPDRSEAEMEDELVHPQTGNPVQVSSSWRRWRRTFHVTWIYDQLFPDGTVDRLELDAIHHLTSYKTYAADIEKIGLVVKEYYGDFDLSEYKADSPYLILLVSH